MPVSMMKADALLEQHGELDGPIIALRRENMDFSGNRHEPMRRGNQRETRHAMSFGIMMRPRWIGCTIITRDEFHRQDRLNGAGRGNTSMGTLAKDAWNGNQPAQGGRDKMISNSSGEVRGRMGANGCSDTQALYG